MTTAVQKRASKMILQTGWLKKHGPYVCKDQNMAIPFGRMIDTTATTP